MPHRELKWEIPINVIPKDRLPVWYTDWVDRTKTKYTNLWNIKCIFDKLLFEERVVRWVPRMPRCEFGALFLPIHGFGQVPGECIVDFVIQANWWEMPNIFEMRDAKTREEIDRIFDLFEKDIEEVIPGWQKHCIWKTRSVGPFCIATTPGLVGKHLPYMQQAPGIEGLYIASDTTTGGIGIQSCAKAALICADLILRGAREPMAYEAHDGWV